MRAGSTSEENFEGPGTLHPTVFKTFIKGVIAIAVFSIFFETGAPLFWYHYAIFLAVSLAILGLFVVTKHMARYELGDSAILIKRFLRKPNEVSYRDIGDLSVAQGMLARRFNCGTVYMILKEGKGSLRVMGGGVAEQLEDVHDPNRIFDFVSSKLGPFNQGS